jgi:Aldo/keto reductase family
VADLPLGNQFLQRSGRLLGRGVTILPYAAAHDIGVLVYGPLAQGLLSGRMSESTTFDADDWRGKSPDFTAETFRRNLAGGLRGFARRKDISLPQLAVAWTLANPAVHITIVGARRPSQLDETAQAADIELSTSDMQAIDEMLTDAVPVWGPHPEACERSTRWQKLALPSSTSAVLSALREAGVSEAGGRCRRRQPALRRRPLSRSSALLRGASALGRRAAAGGAASESAC